MTTSEFALREDVEEIAAAESDEDDLLTVAVPPEKPVGETLEAIEEDHAEAEYLDADETSSERRAVLDAAQHVLHRYDETPENGLVLYVGAVEGDSDVTVHVFDDLPAPVDEAKREWANEFDEDVLASSTHSAATYGLLVVERGGAALGRFDGESVEVVETLESDVMGKTKAGGQSADRFERDRERQKEEFFDEVAGEAKRAFIEDDEPAIEGLLVGGTTVTIDEFADGDYLDHRLQDAIVGGSFSVEYASEQGLNQLVERGREAMADAEWDDVEAALGRFRDALRDEEGDDVIYGDDAVDRALEYGAVETLLISGDRPAAEIREYEERTSEEGGDVIVVPPETDSGRRFDETFGLAAILRFPVE